MIHAINKRKTSIEMKEDTKTSMIMGTMLHLPTSILLEIIKKACRSESKLFKDPGNISFVEFWPKWSVEGKYKEKITNSLNVEPDLFISFQKYDLIIEVKINDGFGQYKDQWRNEVYSYLNKYGKKKELFLITLGGNNNLNPEYHTYVNILKCSLSNFMTEVEILKNKIEKHQDSYNFEDSTLRILQDLLSTFKLFGISYSWLENIEFKKYNIELDSTFKLWK